MELLSERVGDQESENHLHFDKKASILESITLKENSSSCPKGTEWQKGLNGLDFFRNRVYSYG
jgi:hypothetical protein